MEIMWKPVRNDLPKCIQTKSLFNFSTDAYNGDNSTRFIPPFYHINIGKNC